MWLYIAWKKEEKKSEGRGSERKTSLRVGGANVAEALNVATRDGILEFRPHHEQQERGIKSTLSLSQTPPFLKHQGGSRRPSARRDRSVLQG